MGYFLQATGNRDLTVNLNIIFSEVKINNLHNLKYFKFIQILIPIDFPI